MPENKKNLAVTIQTKELKFAIMNKTHVTARSLQAAGKLNYEAAAHMQGIRFERGPLLHLSLGRLARHIP